MKVVVVNATGNGRRQQHSYRRGGGHSWGYRGLPCAVCKRAMREGQRVLRMTDRNYVHMDCLALFLRDEPEFMTTKEREQADDEFEKLRQRLMKNVGPPAATDA